MKFLHGLLSCCKSCLTPIARSFTTARTPSEYKTVSRKLGNLLADGGHMTVNGAGKV